jgi:hypothetical protein
MPRRVRPGRGVYRYSNWQWRVTRKGLATHSHGYFIDRARLPEMRDYRGRQVYSWPVHLAEHREWCIPAEFNSAFEAAMKIHFGGINPEIFERTLSAVRDRRRELC